MHLKIAHLFLLICIIFSEVTARDVLFKSNGDKLTAKVLLKSRDELTYRAPGDKDSVLHHISTSILDSAISSDGTKDLFLFNRTTNLCPTVENPFYGQILIGFDAGAFAFYGQSLSVSYEHLLLDRHLGLKAQVRTSLNETDYYDMKIFFRRTPKISEPFTKRVKNSFTRLLSFFLVAAMLNLSQGCNYFKTNLLKEPVEEILSRNRSLGCPFRKEC